MNGSTASGGFGRQALEFVRIEPCTGLLLLALLALLSDAKAQEAGEAGAPRVDLEEWLCEYCAFEEGWRSELELGIGYVSDDSYKFGEYNGLNEEGAYLIAGGYAAYRGEDAAYTDISVFDLGLDSRTISVEGGRQGSYDLRLRYDEIPHFVSDSAATPYRGNGGDRLSLPSNWVTAGSTAGMTALGASLRDVDIETERKRLGGGISITTESPWSYRVDLRHDEKDGNKVTGGTFFFNTAQLIEPVDYVTDEIDAAVIYTEKRWQASLSYYGSTFTNENESLTFDNAYNPIVAGADTGQLALPPDNEFHQLSLAAAWQIDERNHVSAQYALGRMEQDEALLQATLNPSLVVPSLPADSADAEIDTTNARIRLVSRVAERLTVTASLARDERDNKTPQLMYDWVTTDAFVAAQRANLPYSYTRDSLSLQADFDYTSGGRLGFGYDLDERERTFQEVEETTEDSLWGSIRVRNLDNLFLEFKLATSRRDASSSELVAEIDPPQNPLMTKYNLAERDRDSLSLHASYMPAPDYTVGVSLDVARDDYDDSVLGLTKSSDNSINFEFASMLTEETGFNAFVGRQEIDSEQAGSSSFADPDWFAEVNDRFDVFGIGVTHVLIEDALNIGVDLSRSRSRGEIDLQSGAPGAPFPDLETELDSLRLYLDYRLDENLALRVAYWHEEYDSDDWALDDVDPDTVANLLALGMESPSYDNDVVKLSMSYRF